MAPPSAPLPFEARNPGFWLRVGRTLRLAGTAPMDFYAAVPRGASLWAPWRLKLLFAAPAYLCAALGLGVLQLTLLVAALTRPTPLPREALAVCPALFVGMLLAGPVLQGASMVLGGVLLHGLLWAGRGTRARVGLRQTMRALGYTQAMVGLVGLVPPLGVAAYPASKVVLGLGLARMHQTQPWRGLVAAGIQALLTFLGAVALVLGLVYWLARLDEKSRDIVLPPAETEPLPEHPTPNRILANYGCSPSRSKA